MNVEATLEKIRARLQGKAGDTGLAVFVRADGEVKMTNPATVLFRDTFNAYPDRLLAIYDSDAEYRWIKEDVQWAADNMVAAVL